MLEQEVKQLIIDVLQLEDITPDDIDAIVAFLKTLTDAPFEDAARRNLATQAARRGAMAARLSVIAAPVPPLPPR